MKIIKSIIVAFSMYSKIPMPRFKWNSDDMKYHLIFFPWVGGLITGLEYLWLLFCGRFQVSRLTFSLVAVAIPIIITGGFHLDGYMDTCDALASYQSKEKRLEILKDPHIGAFSVIRLCTYMLLLVAAIYSMNRECFLAWTIIFFISRAVSGICVVQYKKAKSSGSLVIEARTANEKIVRLVLAIEIIIVGTIAGGLFQYAFTVSLVGLLLVLIYYIYMAHSKFGGITGDLAGWFVCQAELFAGIFAGLTSILMRG